VGVIFTSAPFRVCGGYIFTNSITATASYDTTSFQAPKFLVKARVTRYWFVIDGYKD